MNNLETLERLLWAVGTDGKPALRTDDLLVLTAGQVAAHVRSGRILLLTRERVESIVQELEGSQPMAVDYESFYDVEEYPDTHEMNFEASAVERERTHRKPGETKNFETRHAPGQKIEMRRQKAIDLLRERGPLSRADLCVALGENQNGVEYIVKDARFIRGGRGQAVRLDEVAIERHKLSLKLCQRPSSIKNCIEMVYTELTLASSLKLEQLVAVLQYDEGLIKTALESEKFERVGDRWRIRRKQPPKHKGFAK